MFPAERENVVVVAQKRTTPGRFRLRILFGDYPRREVALTFTAGNGSSFRSRVESAIGRPLDRVGVVTDEEAFVSLRQAVAADGLALHYLGREQSFLSSIVAPAVERHTIDLARRDLGGSDKIVDIDRPEFHDYRQAFIFGALEGEAIVCGQMSRLERIQVSGVVWLCDRSGEGRFPSIDLNPYGVVVLRVWSETMGCWRPVANEIAKPFAEATVTGLTRASLVEPPRKGEPDGEVLGEVVAGRISERARRWIGSVVTRVRSWF